MWPPEDAARSRTFPRVDTAALLRWYAHVRRPLPWRATRDPWLDPIRARPEFRDYLSRSAARYGEAVKAFLEAGGDRVLGVSPAVTA